MEITSNVLVIANGIFPISGEIAELFKSNSTVICCDGAVKKLTDAGYEPDIIIGDMDSISEYDKNKYRKPGIRRRLLSGNWYGPTKP